jgi:acyl dehydratase
MTMGYFWEEFTLGETFQTEMIKVTADMVRAFSEVSGDHNPFHMNEGVAKQSIYKSTVAHGMLIVSLFTGMNRKLGILKDTSMGVIHMDWDFKKPVYINDTIYYKMVISYKRETSKPDRGILHREITVCHKNGEELQYGKFINLVKRKEVRT